MLNRTNRTLSAHLNRLNLGTRSLASLASLNNGAQTLHTRHAFAVAMRAGMVGVPVSSITSGGYAIPSIPGSPSVSSWLITSCAIHPRVDIDVDRPSDVDRRVNAFDLSLERREEPGLCPTRPSRGRGKAGRKPYSGKRWQQGSRPAIASRLATPGLVVASHATARG
jgi:hypothetical protein